MSQRSVRFAAVAALAALGCWGWAQDDDPPERGIEWWAQSREARRANSMAALQGLRDLLPSAQAASAPHR